MALFDEVPNAGNCNRLQLGSGTSTLQPTENHYLGTTKGAAYVNDHAIYWWDLSDIPKGAIVTAAVLSISPGEISVDRDFDVEVWRLVRSGIDKGDSSWEHYDQSAALDWALNGAGDVGDDIDTKLGYVTWLEGVSSGRQDIELSVSEVAKWLSEEKPNYGVMLRCSLEQWSSNATIGTRLRVRGTLYEPAGDRPELTITYIPVGGHYWIM